MSDATALRKALLARRRELIDQLAAGTADAGFPDAGLVSLLAETQTVIDEKD
jgi:hypothetical protein